MVVSLEAAPNGFDLRLDSGETLTARRVVVASGIRAFDYIPPELRGIPPELITHSAAYGDASHLAGRDVLVVGAGASATDVAALLKARGAKKLPCSPVRVRTGTKMRATINVAYTTARRTSREASSTTW